jgi:hypothetical protein
MNFHRIRNAAVWLLAGVAFSGLSACSFLKNMGHSDSDRPVVAQVDPDPKDQSQPVTPPASAQTAQTDAPDPAANQPASTSTVTELQQLIQNRQVAELRTTYNGTYGASLLFKADDLTYYVALFQQKNFWQIYKTTNSQSAESTYRAFAAKSASLAAVDIRRIQLQAEYARTEKMLSTRTAQLNTLQADAAVRQQQDQQVAARQQQLQEETQALASQQADARKQLRDLQRQINNLQSQQDQPPTISANAPKSQQNARSRRAQQGS